MGLAPPSLGFETVKCRICVKLTGMFWFYFWLCSNKNKEMVLLNWQVLLISNKYFKTCSQIGYVSSYFISHINENCGTILIKRDTSYIYFGIQNITISQLWGINIKRVGPINHEDFIILQECLRFEYLKRFYISNTLTVKR